MKLLFKTPSPTATIGQTNFKDHYPFVEGSKLWSEIQTSVRQATQTYILPIIGRPMHDALFTDYEANTTQTDKVSIIEGLQDAIAHYAIYRALPYMPYIISSTGITASQPTEGARATTHGERKDARYNAHLDADAFLDNVIAELEGATGEYWKPYHDFAQLNHKTSAFFQTADQLSDHLQVQGRRAFQALVPHLKKAEANIIKVLGRALFKQQRHLNNDLVELIRGFVAHEGLTYAIPYLTLVIESDGFKIVSRGDGIEERNGLKHQQHENAIQRLLDGAKANAESSKVAILEYLVENQDDYPLWLQSDYYLGLARRDVKGVISTGDGAVFLRF
jgi:hypothetical protein